MTTDILVVGDIAWDTIVMTERWPERDHDFPAVVHEGPGGQGFNIASWARAAGARVALVTQLGTCARSRDLRSRAQSAGIELWAPTRADPLTRVVSVVDKEGQKALLTHPGPGPLNLPKADWQALILALSGYLLARDGGPARARAWLRWARDKGVEVAADFSHPDLASLFVPIAAEIGWLFGNEAEWAAFAAAGGVTPSRRVIKRGGQGAEVVTVEGSLQVKPEAIARSGDSTGAGDCLMGTFLAGLVRGLDLRTTLTEAVRRAATVAAATGSVPHVQ